MKVGVALIAVVWVVLPFCQVWPLKTLNVKLHLEIFNVVKIQKVKVGKFRLFWPV